MSKNRRVYHTEDIYTKQDFVNDNSASDFDSFSPYNQQQQQQQHQQQQYEEHGSPLNALTQRIPHTAGKILNNPVKPKINPDLLPSPVDFLAQQIQQSDANLNPDYILSTLDVHSSTLPPASIPFNCVDHGYSPPNHLRLSTYAIPATNDLTRSCQLPLGMVIDPFNDRPASQIPQIDSFSNSGSGPPRCTVCRAYINPSVKFINGGKHWQCNLCKNGNTVDDDYFSALDPHTYTRLDREERPELNFGSVDFILPQSYYALQPAPSIGFTESAYVERPRAPTQLSRLFLIDVGLQSRQSGLLHTLSLTIKDALYSSPTPLNTPYVGFITYDSTLHFHDLSAERDIPSLMIVPDTDEPFNPLVNGLIVDVNASKHNILAFLGSLPTMFSDTSPKGSILGSALVAGLDVLREVGGELNIFQSQLPTGGLGALTERDPAPGGTASVTERDRSLYTSATTWWSNTAEALTDAGVGVNMFMFPYKYTDVGTLSSVAQYTGGESYFYPKFDPARHALKLRSDLSRITTRGVGYNASVKIRCSKGFHIDQHYGSFLDRNSNLSMGTISADSCLSATIAHDAASLTKGWGTVAANALHQAKEGLMQADDEVHFQVAVLYTGSDGLRKVRVLNSMAKLSDVAATVFRHADVDAGAVLLYKQAASHVFSRTLGNIRDKLVDRSVQVLVAYRKHCAQSNKGGQVGSS